MVDTDRLRSKATEVGKSVASSFTSGAKKATSEMQKQSTSKERNLYVTWSDETGRWSVEGPTAGYGTFATKKEAKSQADKVYNNPENYNTGEVTYKNIRVETRDGAISTSESTSSKPTGSTKSTKEDISTSGFGGLFGGGNGGESQLESKQPELPFMGQQPDDSGADEERPGGLPFMGQHQGEDSSDRQQPQLPFMGGEVDKGRERNNHPLFGPPQGEGDDERQPPFF